MVTIFDILTILKGDNDSAESFEKKLSVLATKISKTSGTNDLLRTRARKVKVGWTIYGGFTYILAALIFLLVTGWQNWGAVEYTVVAGGPLVYVRTRRTRDDTNFCADYTVSASSSRYGTITASRIRKTTLTV